MMENSPVSPFGWDWINDLCAITEDKSDCDIADYLLHRVERGQIYTWIGPLLLSLHPGDVLLKNLYDETHRNKYSKGLEVMSKNIEPHIYAIASRARYRLFQGLGKVSQVIVISGESGTGKTFNARKIIDFLATIDQSYSGRICFPDGLMNIAHEIGNIWPLIAAFSTARTEKNSRSSRHGQLVRLQYHDEAIRGACVHSFLLERTRVTRENDNFHIFYQMMCGLAEVDLRALKLSLQNKYTLLGDDFRSQEAHYQTEFFDTNKAMNTLGFSNDCKVEILQVLALLVHMGNIKFTEMNDDGCAINLKDDNSAQAFENTLILSGINKDEMINLLTSTIICPPSSKRRYTMYKRSLKTTEDCRNRLYSIIRYLYDRLFHWLVDRVNETLSVKNENYNYLGILDIFGFECFETNGLEQLCINYATERMQLYFIEKYLEDGQRELEEEGLNILPAPSTLNLYQLRVNIIENTLFASINDACQLSITLNLTEKIDSQFERIILISNTETFSINHYSCVVKYSIDDILNKNTDKIPTELSSTFYDCKIKLLNTLTNITENNINVNGRVSSKKSTTLLKTKESLDSLMKELNQCDVHYVRCVKPRKVRDIWMKADFNHQLSCSGILDALPLAKCKFPIRLSYKEFYKRYFHTETVIDDFKLQSLIELKSIETVVDLQSNIHVGKQLIFLTEELFFEFERLRKNRRSNSPGKPINESRKSLNSPISTINRAKSTDSSHDDVFLPVPGQSKTPKVLSKRRKSTRNINNNLIEPINCPAIRLNDGIIWDSGDYTDSPKGELLDDWKAKADFIAHWIQNVTSSNDVSMESQGDTSPTSQQETDESTANGNNVDKRTSNVGKFAKFKRCSLRPTGLSSDGAFCVIMADNCRLFYKNRILSRRRLAMAPIRFHTRATCLINSHCIPRSELPNGLEDCL